MKRFVVTGALLAALAASPAFAQAYNPEDGTGNVIVDPPSWQAQKIAPMNRGTFAYAPARTRADNAFAYASQGSYGIDPNSPAATGGGSLGYNQLLLQY
ncbi:MAG: hypothetical protein IRY89_08420 [Pseudolabrys sp.]|nr:hypothetical protein [Pseudolabrys sp.]